jgi:EmrB/QacA subfamily drug resistance transporter
MPLQTVAGHKFERSTVPLLLTLGLGVFAGAFDLGVISPALAAIGAEFGTSNADLSFVFTVYLLTNVIAIPIAGKLSDTFGRRSVYSTCLSIFALGSVVAVLAPNYYVFLLGRAIQAAGAGGIFPVATATIADVVPQERRGSALGILGAIWGFAGIAGPIAGGALTTTLGWPTVFIANVPLALIVIYFANRLVPSVPAKRRGPLDVMGICALALTLGGLMIALTKIDARSLASGPALSLAGLGSFALGIIWLIATERNAREPMISPRLFASRQLVVTYSLEILIGLLEGSLFFIPAALVAKNNISAAHAGFIAAAGAVVFVAVIPLAGRALDKYGSRIVLSYGGTLTAIGLALFALNLHNLVLAAIAVAIAGIGFGSLLGAPTRYIISSEAPGEMRASAIGLLSVFLIIGQIVGGSFAGGIVGLYKLDGFRNAYLAFAVVGLIVAIGTRFLKSREAERASAQPNAA